MTPPWLALLPMLVAGLGLLRRRLPVELAALGLAIAAVLAGWLSPAEALAGFGNPAVLTVVAMFAISAAVGRTGVLAPIERWLAGFSGQGLSGQLLLLALVVGPLSAVISNTAVVAIFIPVVERWCRSLGVSPARMLLPLSFLTVLAGMGTLLGTSTSLVASSLAAQLGYGPFSLLQFTPMALPLYLAGALLLALLAPRLLPREAPWPGGEALARDYGLDDYLSELLVQAGSPLVGSSLDGSLLQHRFDLRVLALIREGERLSGPLGEKRLRGGDVLVVRGRRERLLALPEQQGLSLVPDGLVRLVTGAAGHGAAGNGAAGHGAAEESAELTIVEGVVPSGSRLIGQSLRELRFAQRFQAAVLAIRRGEDLLRDRLGREPLRLGDALLLQLGPSALRALEPGGDLLLGAASELPSDRRDRLPWVLALVAALLLLALWRSDALAIWALLAVIGLVFCRALTPQEVYAAVRWDVVVLLAALLPLAGVLARTGADRWLVEHWLARVATWPPYGLLIALYLLTALLTELISNQAAVTVMLPLGLALGQAQGVSVPATLGVMTFAASHSFLTPIGYQTNTMVYALGGYSFLDFLRLGLPLTLLLSVLTPALALAMSP
jgi:di/tricarboxylate transporter